MNKLEQKIITLQEKIYIAIESFTGFPDISKSFLPDKQIAINILKKRNPYITEEQCELIIGGVSAAKQAREEARRNSQSNNNNTNNNNINNNNANNIQNALSSADRGSIQNQVYPLPSANSIYEEVKKLKDEVRENVMLFVNSQIDIVQDLAKLAIKIGTSIAGAAVLIAPLSFNLPAAISLLLVIIDGLNLLIKKCMEILSNLGPMNNLVLVLPNSIFDSLTLPIIAFLEAMIQILDKITSVRAQIDNLISSVLSFLNPNNLLSLLQSIIDEITKKEKEKQALDLLNQNTDNLQKDINDLKKRKEKIENIKSGTDTDIINLNKLKTPADTKSLANDFLKTLGEAKTEVQNVTEIIYDLTLPDGSVILDVDPDTIENLKEKFNVVYKD